MSETPSLFFDGWSGPLRVILVGSCAYFLLIALLRSSGKRTLAKLNAFDLTVTVALGSTLATILLSSDVVLVEGMTALLLLVVLQWLVAYLSTRSRAFARAVRSEPTLLLRDGEPLSRAMRRERVTRPELESVARREGHRDLDKVSAIVLESDGSFSVIA